jgi:phosphatidate cytidylyltransferase
VIRVLSGAALIVLATLVIWAAPLSVFYAVAVVLAVLAAHELVGLARATGLVMPRVLSELAAGLMVLAASRPVASEALAVWLLIFLSMAIVALSRWQGGASDALAMVSVSLLPSVYIALPLASLVAIRVRVGPAPLFLLIATVIVSDTAQYYAGRAFGRTPLAPRISPAKTVEGALGGLVVAPLALAFAGIWWSPRMPVVVRGLVGLAIVGFGIAGDLFESMLKRTAGVKDSSTLIPGHGGVLDRIDALLFAGPVYYIALLYAQP